ncbi:ribonuclease H, partial [Trifolium pratense]
MDQVCEAVNKKLSDDQKDWCSQPYNLEEVKEAVDQMHPLKAPGPDGIPALFFQKYWHIVGKDTCLKVLSILNDNGTPESLNRTFVALIPKCKNPGSPNHFRPISLCNVIMKIVTKCIANRMKCILPEVVDEEQSAFVKGRLITDNALIAMECFHWMKKKTKGKKGMMALKLDMAKAYDRMEWPFIRSTLQATGFPPTMINLIMNCISTVSYQLLVNGQPSRSFKPERGIRQGDPLSPYVFILCANVLSGMLHKGARNNKIHGLQVARNAPKITHLLFADDSLLFARANQKEAEVIINILQTYQTASGQLVSLEKSEVSFSRNLPTIEKNMICNKIDVKAVTNHSKYLGLPVIFGRSKKEIFASVQERIWKKIKGWKEKCLSRAGKETLIKSVAQAIPNYIMSCYKLPTGCCDNIEAMLAKFWWGTTEKQRKIHWVSWNKLGKAKSKGGLGFRSFEDFNKALLGKQCWRLLQNPDSLLAKVFKSRYFPRSKFMDANVGYQPSYAWRSLCNSREVIDVGARWLIGNGKDVHIWNDKWLPAQDKFKVWSPVSNLAPNAMVSDLINLETKMWDKNLVQNCFNSFEAEQILNIPLSWRLPADKLIWHWEKNGEFSVRSAYHMLSEIRNQNSPEASSSRDHLLWKAIWKVKVPNCIKNFLWRLAKAILPTRSRLEKKGITLDTTCPLCFNDIECNEHLFMHCPLSKQVWFSSPLGLHAPNNVGLISWMQLWLSNPDKLASQLFSTTLWMIWKGRNKLIFKNVKFCPIYVAAASSDFVAEFNSGSCCNESNIVRENPDSWEPPEQAKFKVNIDAGCFSNGTTGWGMIMRNHLGMVDFAATHLEKIKVSPTLAEAMALRWCLKWIQASTHHEHITIESDSEISVKCLHGSVCDVLVENIIQD